jgi:hypothetical protein
LTDPPRRIRRKLVAAPPIELLDGADEAERAFLNQVEKGETLVPVVLRDRDHQPQVGLDHPSLCLLVAALDALCELDLLRSRQQLVTAGLTQEQLQGIRRRLDWGREQRGDRTLVVFDHVDPARLELAVYGIGLERIEAVHLENVRELRGL